MAGVVIGIMDPVMSYRTADYLIADNLITEADRRALGLIGWNIGRSTADSGYRSKG